MAYLESDLARARARRALAGLALFALFSHACLLGPPDLVDLVGGREMAAENLGALAFLAASLLYLATWQRGRAGLSRRGLALLGCAAFLFVAFGEEASWGQHWLGFATPETFKEANAQQETNLHNLWTFDSFSREGGKKAGWAALLLNSNRLFDAAVVGFFAILPLFARWPAWSRRLLATLGPPAPPLLLLWALALDWLLTLAAELWVVAGSYLRHLAVSEIRECNYAMLFLAAAWLAWRQGADSPGEPATGRPI